MCCAPNRSLLQTGPICCEQLELFAKPKNSIIVLLTYPTSSVPRYSTGTLPVGYTGTQLRLFELYSTVPVLDLLDLGIPEYL